MRSRVGVRLCSMNETVMRTLLRRSAPAALALAALCAASRTRSRRCRRPARRSAIRSACGSKASSRTVDRGTSRSAARRADQALRGHRQPPAGRARPADGAGAADGMRRPRLLLAVRRPAAAMRPDQQPDPADAREPRQACWPISQRLQGNTADREGERRAILASLAQNDCGPQYRAHTRSARQRGGFFESLFGGGTVHHARPRRCRRRRQRRHLPHRLRAHLRRLLFPDLVLDDAGELRAGRAGLPAPVPGGGGGALQPPQSGRGHRAGGLDRRAHLFRTAQRIRLPQGVQSVLQLPRAGPDLGRCAASISTTARSSAATSW